MDKDLKDMTLGQLQAIAEDMGQRSYSASYIFRFTHALGVCEISDVSPISKAFRAQLAEKGYYISRLGVERKLTDPDGTVKYLLELPDGERIEAVLLSDGDRKTVCISTQAGCAMNCAFCATGKLKLKRDLTAGEIVEQVYAIKRDAGKVSNVVYMGMGEPLQNYDNVLRSVRLLNHAEGMNLGIRHITVSTCGDVPGIMRLAEEDIHPRLAVSLNAADDALRSELMPINRKHPLGELLKAVNAYQKKTKDRVTFEYVLIGGVNDGTVQAKALASTLSGVKCNVNLIEYNPHPACNFVGSDRQAIERFAEVLRNSGVETVVRLKKGASVKAACGQLGAQMLEDTHD